MFLNNIVFLKQQISSNITLIKKKLVLIFGIWKHLNIIIILMNNLKNG